MPTSRVGEDLVLIPAKTQLERFLDIDACAIAFDESSKHLRKMVNWGFIGCCGLGFLAWESERWMALISLFLWIMIAGSYFIPQAKKDVNRVMNILIARISFLDGAEKHLYVQRMESVALGRKEVAHELGRDVF